MTDSWTALLVKDHIGCDLIRELKDELPKRKYTKLLDELSSIIVTDKRTINRLDAILAKLHQHLSGDSYASLRDEIAEIKDDNKWQATKRGKYVLAINKWAEPFYSEFRSYSNFKDVLIGGHIDRLVVFVCGRVATQADYNALLAYVQSKGPPYKLLVQVQIKKRLTSRLQR